jgi:hypothetical protein
MIFLVEAHGMISSDFVTIFPVSVTPTQLGNQGQNT